MLAHVRRFVLGLSVLVILMLPTCLRTGSGGCGGGPGAAAVCRCPEQEEKAESVPDSTKDPVRGGEISIHLEAEPPHLLGLLRQDASIYRIVQHDVVEALVREDPLTGSLLPELAQSWEVSEDRKRITFHLRPDARWHDGNAFTSSDVVFTFDRLLDPRGGAAQRSDFDQMVKYSAPDSLTFEIELSRPDSLFMYNLESLGILPRHVFDTSGFSGHPALRAPVGTGPFRFVKWEPGENITLERFDDYWGQRAWLDRVVYRIVLDKTVALQMMRRGELDVMPRIGEDQLDAPSRDPLLKKKYRMLRYKPPRISYFVYNIHRKMFRDVRTRRAMAHLIDRESLRCSIARCMGNPLTGIWPSDHACTPGEIKPLGYDPALARKYLDEAGWRDADGDGIRDRNNNPFIFSLLVATASRTWQRASTVVQADLRRAGIKMNIVTVDWSVFLQRLKDHEFDAAVLAMSFFSWENLDPAPLFHCASSKDGQNYGGWCDAEADALMSDYRRTFDQEKRREICRSLSRRLYDAQPVTFLNAPELAALVRRDVRGITISDLDMGESDIWIDPGGSK